MADVRDGLGPFLGVFLQLHGWSPGAIGAAMSAGGLAGMLATTPAGALVDATRHKRGWLAGAALAITLATLAILFLPSLPVVGASQIATGVAAALVAPAIAGLTLGLVGQAGYARQLGRNEAFNHAGNALAAILAGVGGYLFGLGAVFLLMALMAACSLLALQLIDPAAIDHQAARGLEGDASAEAAGGLLRHGPLLVLAATLALFHLGNAAMLPLLGQRAVAMGLHDAAASVDPAAYTAATVVIAQATMIAMALLAARLAQRHGFWPAMVLGLAALPLRGLVAWGWIDPWAMVPVQMLDGVGAGLLGVATPGLVARFMAGTGRVNLALGAVLTCQGIGAALSPALGGFVAGRFGYDMAFAVLGGIALVALLAWLAAGAIVRPACRPAA